MPLTSDEVDIADSTEVSQVPPCNACVRDHGKCLVTPLGPYCRRCTTKGYECSWNVEDASRASRASRARWTRINVREVADISRNHDSTTRALPATAEPFKPPLTPWESDARSERIVQKVIEKLQNKPKDLTYTDSSKLASRFNLDAPVPRNKTEDLTRGLGEREERLEQDHHTSLVERHPITIPNRPMSSQTENPVENTQDSQSSLLVEYFEAEKGSAPSGRPDMRVKVVPSRRKEDLPAAASVSKPSPFMDDDIVRPRVGKGRTSEDLAAAIPPGTARLTARALRERDSEESLMRQRRRKKSSRSDQKAAHLAPSSTTPATAPRADADASSASTFPTLRPSHKVVDGDAHSNRTRTSLNNPKLLQSVEDAIRRIILPELKELKKDGRFRPYIPNHFIDSLSDLSELEEHEKGPRRRSSRPSSRRTKMKAQLKLYFSPDNIAKDKYLQTCMDSQGFVALNVIAGIKEMKSLLISRSSGSYDVLCDVASDIAELEYAVDSYDEAFVRLREQWRDFVLPMEERLPHARRDGPVGWMEKQSDDLPPDEALSVNAQRPQPDTQHGQHVPDVQISQQNKSSQMQERELRRRPNFRRDPNSLESIQRSDSSPKSHATFVHTVADFYEYVDDKHNLAPLYTLSKQYASEGEVEIPSEDKGNGAVKISNEGKAVGIMGTAIGTFLPEDQNQAHGFQHDETPMTVPASFENDTSTYASYGNPYAPRSSRYTQYSNPYAPYSSAPKSNSYSPRSDLYAPDSNLYASKKYDLKGQRDQLATLSTNSYGNTNVCDRGTAILGNVYNAYYVQEPPQNVDEMSEQQQAFIIGIMKLAAQHGIETPNLPVHKDKDQVERWVREVFEAQMCATTIWDGESVVKPPTIGSSMAYFEHDG